MNKRRRSSIFTATVKRDNNININTKLILMRIITILNKYAAFLRHTIRDFMTVLWYKKELQRCSVKENKKTID